MSLTNKLLSGIEINQNDASHGLVDANRTIWQEFRLPQSYARGFNLGEKQMPELSGLSILTSIGADSSSIAVLDWTLERYLISEGWTTLASGTTVGVQSEGPKVWFDIYFDDALSLDFGALDDNFRFSITGRDSVGIKNQVVSYIDGTVTINNLAMNITLTKGAPYLFDFDGYPAILYLDPITNLTYFSQQQGPTGVWTGALATSQNPTAYDGTDPVAPLAFRLLTVSADSGRDIFGNAFRHTRYAHTIDNVSTLNGDTQDAYWMSKPNPSAFAVENQYFDISQDGSPSVVDSLLLDPVTPNVYFNIYYSNEGNPGVNPDDWNSKLWTRVPKVFQATKRDTYVLPQPFTARYAKIEYTHLQPRTYNPGPFQQPIKYIKHPKWVLDYFLLRLENVQQTLNNFTPRSVTVQYDALDLAYNYYLDDLKQSPQIPAVYDPSSATALATFFKNQSDPSDQLDATTLDGVNFATNPYKTGDFAKNNSLLAQLVGGGSPVATETGANLFRDLSPDVSSLNRDAVIFEQNYPVMFFYLTCRHLYREIQALPTYNRAYFVGIREIAWQRDSYSKATDTNLYVEIGGDSTNLQSSDFVHDDTALVINSG